MRAILFAMLVAIGLALVGTSTLSAAPVNGAAVGAAATTTENATPVQYWHGARRSHFRYGSVGPRCPIFCRHRPFTSARVCVRRC